MKKLKNKFIIIIIFIIALIVCFQVFIAYSHSNVDTNSYVKLVKWNGTLNEIRLINGQSNILKSGDKVRVIWESSLAVIEWWDGSLTRLWGNTKISIEENAVSRDYTNINISFDLIAGKTWSNVVSFIGSDSSFTQTFNGLEAWVRGTIFDVDLEKDFLHVSDHLVALTDDSGKNILLNEGEAINLETLSRIDISEFIANIEDAAWSQLNKEFDEEYFLDLKQKLEQATLWSNSFLFLLDFISPKYRILNSLDNSDSYEDIAVLIEKLDVQEKQKVYKAVLSKYQWINFVSANDFAAYKKKIFYKKALIALGDNQWDTQRLVQSSAFDIQDIIWSGDTQWLKETFGLLNENKDILQDVDVSFLSGWLEYIPEGLREEFIQSFGDISSIFNFDTSTVKNINTDSIWDVLDNADGAIQDFLDKNVGGLLKNLAQ